MKTKSVSLEKIPLPTSTIRTHHDTNGNWLADVIYKSSFTGTATFTEDRGMKLFAFQPKGYGRFSFFVTATDEAEARAAVDKFIKDGRAMYEHGMDEGTFQEVNDGMSSSCVEGWPDRYDLTVAESGKVLTNSND